VKKHILITGGAGFIGSHLVDSLLSDDSWTVTVVDNFNEFYSPEIKRTNIADHLKHPDYQLYEYDICCRDSMRQMFSENSFDAIVHLAAWAGVRPSLINPRLYTEVNVGGTVNLLDCAREFGVPHFVFGSSSSVYGNNEKSPFAETDFVANPISPYAATKAAGELICHTFSHLYDLSVVCLRFFTVYGARQRPDLAIHKFARLILDGKPIPVFGDGTTRRDYTYVDDIVQGIRAAIDYRQTQYEIFNLGESHTIELRELIALIEESLGVKAIIDRQPAQPGDVPLTYADITKARQLLNYKPTTLIQDGIPKFVEWLRASKI
jgi:UDP-glucuronate 4-epimerase